MPPVSPKSVKTYERNAEMLAAQGIRTYSVHEDLKYYRWIAYESTTDDTLDEEWDINQVSTTSNKLHRCSNIHDWDDF